MSSKKETKGSISLEECVRYTPMYKVILENDDFINSFQRVVKMIMIIFKYDQKKALDITQEAHVTGQSIVGRWDRNKAVAYVDQLRSAGIGAHMEQD